MIQFDPHLEVKNAVNGFVLEYDEYFKQPVSLQPPINTYSVIRHTEVHTKIPKLTARVRDILAHYESLRSVIADENGQEVKSMLLEGADNT